ncbi:Smr/MutS family protein [Hoeflea sp. WL0058]|uniref:Smr/MutS family protein n=1 Tax=Flavimaribacter sediminis TaxID=2865987 RepID=A0AAE2ZLC3_9HYPH|nr:Smr/MutS family protein [Flavimaribacter sediminis]MBW8638336.1 Smr/MutS family protein [Flavimaribacter sediminis]
MARDRKSSLSDEDRVLWNRVARTVRAYPGKSVADVANEPEAAPATPRKKASAPMRASSAVQPPHSPDLQPIDRSVYRKLSRGRVPIEATIDLHGLTQSQAHHLLRRFLHDAREKGLRHVLVITGKGRSNDGDGILRRVVPLWLTMPEFAGLASGVQPAARGHGGEGALYIRLKRKEKSR